MRRSLAQNTHTRSNRLLSWLVALLLACCLVTLSGCDSDEISSVEQGSNSSAAQVQETDAQEESPDSDDSSGADSGSENSAEDQESKAASSSQGKKSQQNTDKAPAGKDLTKLTDLPDGYEEYSKLDNQGRCGVALVKVGTETLPARGEKRNNSDISKVKPTGWKQMFYSDLIRASNGALYNRCHLIAWSLAAENGNERNLITGTRQLNEAMTDYEKQIKSYVERTRNHVIYRVAPYFKGKELVARGVRLQALSVEDKGKGIDFNVYLSNTQKGVKINYLTGESTRTDGTSGVAPGEASNNGNSKGNKSKGTSGSSSAKSSSGGSSQLGTSSRSKGSSSKQDYVLNTNTMKFHYPNCSSVSRMAEHNKAKRSATRESIMSQGYSPCGVCQP